MKKQILFRIIIPLKDSDMFFQHIYEKNLAQGSYIIGCQREGTAIVVDPRRDIDVYLEVAKEQKLKITHIAETHIHADFLSGSRELALATGAKMYLSDEGGTDWQYEFQHVGLKNGDRIRLGNISLDVLHTPGHTPESISFLITDHAASEEPVIILTGDFVFVGDIGRPDLLEKTVGLVGEEKKGAKHMHESLQRFQKLPDHIQLWPGHGAGSACGKSLGAIASSTVGYEKISNWALKYEGSVEGFAQTLLADQPEPPTYFASMKRLNKQRDRNLLETIPKYPKLSAPMFLEACAQAMYIVDTRPKQEVANGYIQGSIHIQANRSFPTWMGWLFNYRDQIVLVASDDKIEALSRDLIRIGMDNTYGYIPDISSLGLSLQKVTRIDYGEVQRRVGRADTQIIDVRSATEFKAGHIPGATHIFLGTLVRDLPKIDGEKQVVVYCQTGDRASIAYSLLKKNGIKNLALYPGGMKEWRERSIPER